MKGQIVEIPDFSPIYKEVAPDFTSKKELFRWKEAQRRYSLFDGFLVGDHSGTAHFKIGQRRGISVGGKKAPLYVIGIDERENRLFVGAGEHHPGLWTDLLTFPLEQVRMEAACSTSEMEQGIPLNLHYETNDVKTVLYVFDTTVYLEMEQPLPQNLIYQPMELYRGKNLFAKIN